MPKICFQQTDRVDKMWYFPPGSDSSGHARQVKGEIMDEGLFSGRILQFIFENITISIEYKTQF